MTKSVMQGWILELPGLRHQGVLLTAIRGCDNVPKEHISKKLTRAYRSEVLNSFVGDARKALTFIEHFEDDELRDIMDEFCSDLDFYPLHYVMHLAHASEIIGYHHPFMDVASNWLYLYKQICRKLHVTAETKEELDKRLTAEETAFKAAQ